MAAASDWKEREQRLDGGEGFYKVFGTRAVSLRGKCMEQ